MTLTPLLFFLPACFSLNLAPGPNNLLSISNASRYGFRQACCAGIGRLLAFSVMIALAGGGLALVLQASVTLFWLVKILGAAYLFWLAWGLWQAQPAAAQIASRVPVSLWRLMRQEFCVAAGNPKALLIFTAFLPQFIYPQQAVAPQLALLGGVFLVLEYVAIMLYAAIGAYLATWFASARRQRGFNRACASLLASAGAGLLALRSGN